MIIETDRQTGLLLTMTRETDRITVKGYERETDRLSLFIGFYFS